MRPIFLLPVLPLTLFAVPAAAGPDVASLLAERRALLAADAQCRMLSPEVRGALIVSAAQSRHVLARTGWAANTLDGLEARAAASGRAHPCNDPALAQAVKGAESGYDGLARTPVMDFPGPQSGWRARHQPDSDGWTLSQPVGGGAAFGIRAGRPTLIVPAPEGGRAPVSAALVLRDPARAPEAMLDVPGRLVAPGLAGFAPSRATALSVMASARTVETPEKGPRRVVFQFPESVMPALAELDPREAAEIVLSSADGRVQRLYLEVGDLPLVQVYLTSRPAQFAAR